MADGTDFQPRFSFKWCDDRVKQSVGLFIVISACPATAILLDLPALGGFVWVKLTTDLFVIGVAVVAMILVAVAEQVFLKKFRDSGHSEHEESHAHDHQ